MSDDKDKDQGERFRHVRRGILKMTQRELAEALGVSKSLIPMMEGGKQGVSKNTAEMLYQKWGINMTWLLTGVGSPKPELHSTDPPTKTQSECSENMGKLAWRLFMDPECFVDGKCGQFGYTGLNGTKLRIHAGRDKAIADTNLFQIMEDDTLWIAAGEPTGWEFEVLRTYFEYYTDRSFAEWMECLRMVRWVHRVILSAPVVAEYQALKTA